MAEETIPTEGATEEVVTPSFAEDLLNEMDPRQSTESLVLPESGVEEVQEEAAEEVKAEEVQGEKPYTEEEFRQALDSDTYDSKRLSTAQKAALDYAKRQADKHSTKTWQEAAEMRRVAQAEMARVAEQKIVADPVEQYYVKYKADPVKVTEEINQSIAQLEAIRVDDERFNEARAAIAKLQGHKDNFFLRRQQEIESGQKNLIVESKIMNARAAMEVEVKKNIKDFDVKLPELVKFAHARGFTDEELNMLTGPALGPAAIKLVTLINDLYDIKNASSTAEKKRNRTAPILTRGSEKKTETKKTGYSSMDDTDFMAHIEAVKSGHARI